MHCIRISDGQTVLPSPQGTSKFFLALFFVLSRLYLGFLVLCQHTIRPCRYILRACIIHNISIRGYSCLLTKWLNENPKIQSVGTQWEYGTSVEENGIKRDSTSGRCVRIYASPVNLFLCSKTSLMDPRFAPAWVAFGHTFALEGEHDHAVTAYSTCARMFTG